VIFQGDPKITDIEKVPEYFIKPPIQVSIEYSVPYDENECANEKDKII